MPFYPEKIAGLFSNQSEYDIIENQKKKLSTKSSWQRIRMRMPGKDKSVNIAFNLVSFPPENFDLFPVHAQHKVLKDDRIKEAIANAYWQTVWASGQIRVAKGDVEPVAFLPRNRALQNKIQSQTCQVSANKNDKYIFGSENIFIDATQKAIANNRVKYSTTGFRVRGDEELSTWLNLNAFADMYIGKNRSATDTRTIKKIVQVAGSHLISKTVSDLNKRMTQDQISATAFGNAGFFLNFPEEYSHPFSAMNDPIGLIIRDGQMLQLPLLNRGTILIDENNQAKITHVSMQNIALKLPWNNQVLQFESDHGFHVNDPRGSGKNIIVFTPRYQADKAPDRQRTPQGNVVDLSIIFGECVSMRVGGNSRIPDSGFVLSIPDRENAPLILEHFENHGSRFSFQFLNKNLGMGKIKSALAAGPILLQQNKSIADTFFDDKNHCEEFLATRMNGVINSKGVAPTRFPFDISITRAPRSFLAIESDNNLVFGIIDGRFEEHSIGARLRDVAEFCRISGYNSALNLDGGGSSVLQLTNFRKSGIGLKRDLDKGIVNLPSDIGHKDRLMPLSIIITK
ncbi:MAG: hypothetical protein DWQ05_04325 [Calditrichaeota bacterium]|nr:MAG: hypothetical protein DWQ05_04325 [Calditrichota bacterium]